MRLSIYPLVYIELSIANKCLQVLLHSASSSGSSFKYARYDRLTAELFNLRKRVWTIAYSYWVDINFKKMTTAFIMSFNILFSLGTSQTQTQWSLSKALPR